MEVCSLGDKEPKINTDFWIDLQPANILFTVNSDPSIEVLQKPEFSYVHWCSGVEPDNSAPRYLVSSQRPRGMLDDAACSVLVIKIGDMGGGLNSC